MNESLTLLHKYTDEYINNVKQNINGSEALESMNDDNNSDNTEDDDDGDNYTKNGPVRKEFRRLKNLEAQIYYRLHNHGKCVDTYSVILKSLNDNTNYCKEDKSEISYELLTNISAAYIKNDQSLIGINQLKNIGTLALLQSFEYSYNIGLALINIGKYEKAEKILNKSEKLCRHTLEEEELNSDIISSELSVILAQQGLCNQLLKNNGKAENIYKKILKHLM